MSIQALQLQGQQFSMAHQHHTFGLQSFLWIVGHQTRSIFLLYWLLQGRCLMWLCRYQRHLQWPINFGEWSHKINYPWNSFKWICRIIGFIEYYLVDDKSSRFLIRINEFESVSCSDCLTILCPFHLWTRISLHLQFKHSWSPNWCISVTESSQNLWWFWLLKTNENDIIFVIDTMSSFFIF